MRWPLLPVLAVLAGAAGTPPSVSTGAAIAAHGAPGGITPCKVCHGMQLQGNTSIGAPALAGLPKDTVLAALRAIAADKQGDNSLMRRIARTLTPAQRDNIAAYLASLKKPPAS